MLVRVGIGVLVGKCVGDGCGVYVGSIVIVGAIVRGEVGAAR